METKIKWNDGDGYITATYEGSGSGSASISSDVNEGIDREQSIKVETTDKSVSASLVVSQVGLREVFSPSDGDFILADGGTLNVLKSDDGLTFPITLQNGDNGTIGSGLFSYLTGKIVNGQYNLEEEVYLSYKDNLYKVDYVLFNGITLLLNGNPWISGSATLYEDGFVDIEKV